MTARVEYQAEVEYGPNSFGFGKELAERLSPVEWLYPPGAVARLEVAEVAMDAGTAGLLAIFPPRSDVI